MILAGVDEAGLGPTLGPLVTASFALRCPDDWTPASPWTVLSEAFCRRPGETPPPLPVCDSKLLYPRPGLACLEQAVGVFCHLIHGSPEPQPVACTPDRDAPLHPCYDGPPPAFPTMCERESIPEIARQVGRILQAAGVTLVHLEVRLLYEPAFNQRLDAGLNKNQLILEQTGLHLAALAERFAQTEPLHIVVDKQGGRNAYAAYLASLFPDFWPQETESGRESSRYRLNAGRKAIAIDFQAKADRESFATAAASMAAKCIREQAVSRLNSWFCKRYPDLNPTAGYPQDAKRWLSEVGTKQKDLLVHRLIRRK